MARWIKTIGKGLAVVFLSAAVIIPQSAAAVPFDFGAKAGWESFRWKEVDENGDRLLEETGPRYTINAFLGNTMRPKSGFIYNVDARLYFGIVDYDGQTQDGVPAQSDTYYSGFTLEGTSGIRLGPAGGNFNWDVIGKLGYDTWVRDIDDTVDAIGRRVSGAQESYFVLNLRLGTGPKWQVSRWIGRFIAGLKYPVWTSEYLDKEDSGLDENVTLRPKGRLSAFVDFSNRIRLSRKVHLQVDAYYDSYRFDRSDRESTTMGGVPVLVWQPESSQDVIGVQVGVGLVF